MSNIIFKSDFFNENELDGQNIIKAFSHKYHSKKRVGDKWIYDYGKPTGKKKGGEKKEEKKERNIHEISSKVDTTNPSEFVDKIANAKPNKEITLHANYTGGIRGEKHGKGDVYINFKYLKKENGDRYFKYSVQDNVPDDEGQPYVESYVGNSNFWDLTNEMRYELENMYGIKNIGNFSIPKK